MVIGFYTLGCKTNQYETQAMERLLCDRGHTIGKFDGICDAYVINTCSVTAVADKKNRAVIRRCRRDNPGAIIAVCGCYSQHDSEAVKALGVDIIGGSGNRQEFVHNLLAALAPRTCEEGDPKDWGEPEKTPPVMLPHDSPLVNAGAGESAAQTVISVDNALRRRAFEILPAGGLEERTRAMLKVQDGCVNFCSYCIIPYTRGPIRSAPVEVAVAQAEELAARGYREIVVTGIEIASWGFDLPGRPEVTGLIEQICLAVPHLRVRLGSLEPRIVTEDFCQRLQRLPNLCPQFHLSMQSGCDTVLSRMKRKYDTARYYESVCLLNTYFPGCAVTTDMIVAFPGETQEEFAQSLDFIRKCAFADMHIFPYSRRPGTPADKMSGQHNNATKEERSRAAIAVAEEMSIAYRKSLMGKTLDVLFEEKDGEYFTGHAMNYVKVYYKGENLHNEIKTVTVTEVYHDGVKAK